MARKGQATVNLIFGLTILIVGMTATVMWALGESLDLTIIKNVGRWSLGLLPIVIEIIKYILDRMMK